MKGRSTDIAHSRRVGKNWVMTGLWSGHNSKKKKRKSVITGRQRQNLKERSLLEARTRRLSTGRVTLNLSIVLTMMAGVVRKKSSRKSRMLRRTQRSHQREPQTDRFSLRTGEMKHLGSRFSNRNVNPRQTPPPHDNSPPWVPTEA